MKFLLTRMISLSRLWIEIWNAGRKKEMNLRLLHWCLTSPCLLRTFLSQSLLTQPRLLRQVLLLVWCQLVTVYSLCSNGKEMPECSSLDRVHTNGTALRAHVWSARSLKAGRAALVCSRFWKRDPTTKKPLCWYYKDVSNAEAAKWPRFHRQRHQSLQNRFLRAGRHD